MKNLILSLVIAIVSSVNVFGQTIHFNDGERTIKCSFVDKGNYSYEYNTTYDESNNQIDDLPNFKDLIINITNFNGLTTDITYTKVDEVINNTNKDDFNIGDYNYSNGVITIKLKVGNYTNVYTFTIPGSTLSVGNQIEVDNLTLYPNPVKDVLNIRFDSYENVDVVVTDLNGRVVYNENVSGLTSVDLSNQPSGIYLVNVGSTTRKVVKQ